jgi:hypothetical protein
LFGAVASDSTPYRTIRKITPTVWADLNAQTAIVRAKMWRRMSATTGTAMVVLDVDASLVQIHSENKEGTGDLQGRVRVPHTAVLRRRDWRNVGWTVAPG